MKKTLAALACASLAAAALGVNFPLGTYVYTGSALDYRHEALTSDAGALIQAVASNGTVLASSRIVDPVESTGVNFVLDIGDIPAEGEEREVVVPLSRPLTGKEIGFLRLVIN